MVATRIEAKYHVRVDKSQVVVTQVAAVKSADEEEPCSRAKSQVQVSIQLVDTTVGPRSLIEMRDIDSSIHWYMDCEAEVDPFRTICELLMAAKLVQPVQVVANVKFEMVSVDLKQNGKMVSRLTLLISMAVIAAASSSSRSPLHLFASNRAAYWR